MLPLKLKGYAEGIGTIWENATYHVVKRRISGGAYGTLVQLLVERHDRRPARDWRHLQQIKNQLVGPEHEGFELYPAESRKVDTQNITHLWIVEDEVFRIPFGFVDRDVNDDDPVRQRPFSTGARNGCAKRQ